MMVVDTSALMAVVLDEAAADRVSAGLEGASEIALSAVTMAEALIVAGQRGLEHGHAVGAEERRAGEAGVMGWRSRGAPYH